MKSKYIYTSVSFKGLLAICLLCLISATGCKKYLDIPLPSNKVAGEGAYATDRSSAATINSILATFATSGLFDGENSVGYRTGLYADELQNINPNFAVNVALYSNQVNQAQMGGTWTSLYQHIYNANLAIEGVSASSTLLFKNQWLGEAYFLRALAHFYLVNYYGDAVIVTSSDFLVNKELARSPKAEVYKQIIADLLQAQSLLANEYKDASGATTTSKTRPNKFTATALLARTYLYTGDWANAEIQANNVITASGTAYALMPSANIANVFLANSAETIFALAANSVAVKDYTFYNNNMPATIPGSSWLVTGVNVKLSESLFNAFEKNAVTAADDLRKTNWLRSTTSIAANQTYFFPAKYKSSIAGTENIMLFRLAEQYLIRAEARARQNNLDGAKADIDAIRTRAGLTGTTAVTQADLVTAVLKEKRVELFSEVGHRFFDLRRSGTLDAVMNIEAPLKGVGATWNTLKQYFPIPDIDIAVNPNLKQTPGY